MCCLLAHCLQRIAECSRVLENLSNLPLLFIAVSVLATTTGGLAFILLISHLPGLVAAILVYMMLILAGVASAIREYYTNNTRA